MAHRGLNTMPSTMIQSVLGIEREAEAVLAKAETDAKSLLADAATRRDADARVRADALADEVRELGEKAAAERESKVRELAANGEAALSVVRNISDAAFDNGVRYIMGELLHD